MPLDRSPYFEIRVIGESSGERTQKIQHSSFFIGRQPPADLVLPAPNVSRKHARVFFEEGEVWIEDLASSNGVYVDGSKIPSQHSVRIHDEATISFGLNSVVRIQVRRVGSIQRERETPGLPRLPDLPQDSGIRIKTLQKSEPIIQIEWAKIYVLLFDVLSGMKSYWALRLARHEKLIHSVKKESKEVVSAARTTRDEIIQQARTEADALVEDANRRSKDLVSETNGNLNSVRSEIEEQKIALEELKKQIEEAQSEYKKAEQLKAEAKIMAEESENVKTRSKEEHDKVAQGLIDQQTALRKALAAQQTSYDELKSKVSVESAELSNIKSLKNETDRKHKELSSQLQGLEADIKKSHEDKAKIQKLIDDLIEEKRVMRSELEASKRIVKDELSHDMSVVERKAHQILEEAKEKSKQMIEAAQSKSSSILGSAGTEAQKQISDLKEEIARLESKLATDLSKNSEMLDKQRAAAVKNLELELAEIRVQRLKEAEGDQSAVKVKHQEVLKVQVQEAVDRLVDLISKKLKPYLKPDADQTTFAEIEKLFRGATDRVLLGTDFDEQELEAFLKAKPVTQQKKIKQYWVRMALGTVAILAIAAMLPKFFEKSKESARNIASVTNAKEEERIRAENARRAELMKFEPELTDEYKATYVDRVIYTRGYLDKELDPKFREKWILMLNEYILKELKLNENIVVTFIGQEANTLRELKAGRDAINGQAVDAGVAKMKEIEDRFMKNLREVAGGKKNVDKLLAFKKEFYLNYEKL